MYYLQSRYYNPTVGRFLNADIYCDTQSSILGTNMFAYCDNNPINYSDYSGTVATEAVAAGTALSYFVEFVLPELIVGSILIISGAILVYFVVKVVEDAIESAGSMSATNPPPERDNEAEKAWNNIPSSLKNGDKVDLSKFDINLKNGQGKRASNGWRIQKDRTGHKGSVWKLFDKNGNRIASLKGDGFVVGK